MSSIMSALVRVTFFTYVMCGYLQIKIPQSWTQFILKNCHEEELGLKHTEI